VTEPDQLRLLAVHAHPDDETIVTGATLALYAARGTPITVVTCTRGESGEVIPPDLAYLENDGTALGSHRTQELAAAMRVLGVTDHHFLGADVPGVSSAFAPRVYHDSGMAYGPDGGVLPSPSTPPGAFAKADLAEAAARLGEIILARRPRAVLTYDPGGGYGHPDHVRTHEVTAAAVVLAAESGWDVPKLYWIALPQSVDRRARDEIRARTDHGWRAPDPSAPPRSMAMPDELVTTRIDAEVMRTAKAAALREHATQVSVAPDDAAFALSDGVAQPLSAVEWFRLVKGATAGERDDAGRETDLLA
jgi:N-acetyl-1-D-myo-inositol-2-amino-2-deoxy-alpha-D-glucopyranoside deacetylase